MKKRNKTGRGDKAEMAIIDAIQRYFDEYKKLPRNVAVTLEEFHGLELHMGLECHCQTKERRMQQKLFFEIGDRKIKIWFKDDFDSSAFDDESIIISPHTGMSVS